MSYTVGQVVGILHTGSWSTTAQGKYTVTAVNKVRVELARVGDGYVRKFSVKTGKEFGICADRSYIVSEDRYDQHVALKNAEQARKQSVYDIKNAAERLYAYGISADEITIMRALLDEAEKFVVVN